MSRMSDNGVTHALTISTTLETFPAVREVARSQPNLWCTAGVHPDERGDEREATVDDLVAMAADPKVVGIGETGLDYFRVEGDTEWQRERFRIHIRAARRCAKPLVIHTRAAAEDTLRIMREEDAGEVGGVMHCFTETWEVAAAAMELGFHISFSGIVTFKNAKDLKEVARRVPLERMLVETDSPYLAPVPHRGKPNQPAFVKHVAEEIASLRGIAFEEVAAATSRNFFALFRDARAS
jgi:TatD DNase family protein